MPRVSYLLLLLALMVSGVHAAPAPLTHTEIVAALSESRFGDLEGRINAIQSAFADNPAEDSVLMESVWELADLDDSPELKQAFAEWIKRSAESYAARLARGAYYAGLGFKARGTGYSSDTSARQFQQMELNFEQARADLQASLKLNAKPLGSYYELIAMAMRSGNPKEIDLYHQRVLAFAPQSMEIRILYMNHLEPRWGGSFAEMEAYVEESSRVFGPGKKIDRLRALIPGERAHVARDAKNYPVAYEQYTAAIGLDDRTYYRCVRAGVSAEMKRFDRAAEDLETAFSKRPMNETCADQVAWIACCVPEMPRIAEYLDRMTEQFPRHAELRVRRGWLRQESGDQVRAFADFKIAAGRGNAWAQMQTGKYLFNGWGGVAANQEEGLAWLQRAALQGELDAQYSVAEALAFLGRHEEAAEAQKLYLEMKSEAAATAAAKGQQPELVAFPFESALSWLEENRVKLILGACAAFLVLLLFLRRS